MPHRPIRRTFKLPKVKETDRIDCPQHLRWLRGCVCAVSDAFCEGKIEAAHVRIRTDGGTGLKPSDCYAVPLCSTHHREQHGKGEVTFWAKRKLDPRSIAHSYWQMSPAGQKWRRENGK